MTRSISTAIAMTLGLAVSAAVIVTVFAQRNQSVSAASPAADAPAGVEAVSSQAQPSAGERLSSQTPAPPQVRQPMQAKSEQAMAKMDKANAI